MLGFASNFQKDLQKVLSQFGSSTSSAKDSAVTTGALRPDNVDLSKLPNSPGTGNYTQTSNSGFSVSIDPWSGITDFMNGVVDSLSKAYSTSAVDAQTKAVQEANKLSQEIAKQQLLAQQTSAKAAMDFEAKQAEIARQFSKSERLEQQKFNKAESEAQREWNLMMSNTAYQRAVKDMRAAGINPILAYTQGGASTPTYSVPSAGTGSSSAIASGKAISGSKADVYIPDFASAKNADKTVDFLALMIPTAAKLMRSVDSFLNRR